MRPSLVINYEMDLCTFSEVMGVSQVTAKALRDILLLQGWREAHLNQIPELDRYVLQAKQWTAHVDNPPG